MYNSSEFDVQCTLIICSWYLWGSGNKYAKQPTTAVGLYLVVAPTVVFYLIVFCCSHDNLFLNPSPRGLPCR